VKYLTRGQHQKTINQAFFFQEIGLSERGRILKDFVNEHIIIQKAKRRK
jgi:hypothetical protein